MTTESIIAELSRPLAKEAVKTREQSGRTLSYIEGHHAVREANRIFGFGEWSYFTTVPQVVQCEQKPNSKGTGQNWYVGYTASVTVMAMGTSYADFGFGQGIDSDLGRAHESAIKEAVTDALKRALRNFGDPFGLALYDKTQAHVSSATASKKEATKGQQELLDWFKGLAPLKSNKEDFAAFRELVGDKWEFVLAKAKKSGGIDTVAGLLEYGQTELTNQGDNK